MAKNVNKKESAENNKKSALWLNIPLLILVVGFVVILFVQENNIIVIQQRNNEIKELNQEIRTEREQTEYYKKKILELNTSKEELEKISREQYHMKKPNEDVFLTDIE